MSSPANALEALVLDWNALYSAAWGRGIQPRVSERLAQDVGDAYQAFRDWAAAARGVHLSPVRLGELGVWTRKRERLAERVRAEGVAVPELQATPLASVARGVLGSPSLAIGAVAVLLGALLWLRK